MKFSDWKYSILESISYERLKAIGKDIKDNLKDKFDNLYVIPDFYTFERSYEPIQQSILFTDKGLRSFSFNYDNRGDLYSIDFWAPEKKTSKPSKTLYIDKGPLNDVYLLVPEIAKNPLRRINPMELLKNLKKNLNEEAENFYGRYENSKSWKKTEREEREDDEYDFGDPETIFKDMKTYVDMVIEGKQPSLIITGSPGVGKTHLLTKELHDKGLKSGEDFVHVKGRSTAAGMFITLYENNGKLIIFDDCDSVFHNADGVNILKGALDSYGEREISWLVGKPLKTVDGEPVPKSFVFTGRIIFVSNLPQRKIDDAIKSRSFVIEVALTPEDMIKKMKKELDDVLPDTPLFVKEEAMEIIEDIYKKDKDLELNMRTLIKSVKILKVIDDIDVAKRLIMQQCTYK